MIRGDNSMFCEGYAEANQSLKLYNPNKPTSHIVYVDANNLYEHSIPCNFSHLRYLIRLI